MENKSYTATIELARSPEDVFLYFKVNGLKIILDYFGKVYEQV